MSVPANYRPRRGDTILIPTVVTHDYEPGDTYVHTKCDHTSLLIPPEVIDSLLTRKWEPDDRALYAEHPVVVIATDLDYVWCRFDDSPDHLMCRSLELTDRPAEPESPKTSDSDVIVPAEGAQHG